jgi:signal transduction histidine kinase
MHGDLNRKFLMRPLAEFLRLHRDAILEAWTDAVAALPSSTRQNRTTIRDHLPAVVDELARDVDDAGAGEKPADPAASKHAKERFEVGYDVRDIVAEYAILRRTILERYRTADDGLRADLRARVLPILRLDMMIDAAVGDAVDQFVAERDRENYVLNGILSHDLRSPLQSILISAEMMAQDQAATDPAAVRRAARRIHGSAERMNRMIIDLLDFTRAQLGGGLAIVPTPMDLRTVIADVVADVALTHAGREIDNRVPARTDDLQGVWGPVRIAQALTNLLTNAVRHGQDPIVVDAAREGDGVWIDVQNRGEIAPDILPRLFEPFIGLSERGETSRRHGGLGLGLYIVSEIARAHGGRVEVHSERGTTRFRLWLPRAATADAR